MNPFPLQLLFQVAADDPRVGRLLQILRAYGWQTRKELATKLNWDERTIRSVAEAAGKEVVRGQRGFNALSDVDVDELLGVAGQSINQGKKMIRLGIAWRREAHRRVG